MSAIGSVLLLPAPSPASGQGAAARAGARAGQGAAATPLTPEQQAQVAKLQQTDQKVRAHESAHLAAGNGVVTSGARFEYTVGPDGKRYAVGGEVSIDTAKEDEPKANIDKGQRIQRAALAPAEPSSQDYRVAAVGAQLVADGYRDLRIQTREGQDGPSALGQRMAQTYEAIATQTQSGGGSPGGMGISLFA